MVAITDANVAGGACHAWVDLGEDLGTGHFTPDVPGSGLTKVHFVLHNRLDVLHMAVQHGDADHCDQGGNGGDAHAKEGNTAHGLGFALSVLLVHG